MEKINLKIKKSRILEVIKIIIVVYAIFLFFLGIIIKNSEVVIEVIIMFIVAMIFEFLNKEELIVKSEELYIKKYGGIKYTDIESLKITNNIIELKIKNKSRKYKIYLAKNNNIEISKFNKYIISKL